MTTPTFNKSQNMYYLISTTKLKFDDIILRNKQKGESSQKRKKKVEEEGGVKEKQPKLRGIIRK